MPLVIAVSRAKHMIEYAAHNLNISLEHLARANIADINITQKLAANARKRKLDYSRRIFRLTSQELTSMQAQPELSVPSRLVNKRTSAWQVMLSQHTQAY